MTAMAPLLQYGLTGLAAILAFLSYRLLVRESGLKAPRKTMLAAIRSFAVLSVVLALVSAASSAFDTFFGSARQVDMAKLTQKLIATDGENKRLKSLGTSQVEISDLQKQLGAANEELKLLKATTTNNAELLDLRSQLEESNRAIEASNRAAETESQVTTRLVAERLLSDLPKARSELKQEAVGGTVLESTVTDAAEARFRILERAVFEHVADFNGDAHILSRALALLTKQGRAETEGNEARLVQELPRLLQMRFRWLKDDAIPALRADIENNRNQNKASAEVRIPESLWLFRHPSGQEPTETVQDIAKLEAEARLLEELLSRT